MDVALQMEVEDISQEVTIANGDTSAKSDSYLPGVATPAVAETTLFKVVGDAAAAEVEQTESDSGEEEEDEEDDEEDAADINKRIEYYLEKWASLYKCKICKRIVGGKKWHAKRHIRAHWNIRPYACSKCGHRFLRNDHLKRHTLKLRCQGLKDAASAGNPVMVKDTRVVAKKTSPGSRKTKAAPKAATATPAKKGKRKVTQRGQVPKRGKGKRAQQR